MVMAAASDVGVETVWRIVRQWIHAMAEEFDASSD
jgi:hypothetical protein